MEEAKQRLDAAAAEFKKLSDRIKVLEEGQAAFEKTFLAKTKSMQRGYKLMIGLHCFFLKQYNEFVEELKRQSDELADQKT